MIGWAEVGPGFLQAISAANSPEIEPIAVGIDVKLRGMEAENLVCASARSEEPDPSELRQRVSRSRPLEVLLEQARQEDAAHRATYQKPISVDTLRVRLGIGATPARQLIKIVRAEFEPNDTTDPGDEVPTREVRNADATLAA